MLEVDVVAEVIDENTAHANCGAPGRKETDSATQIANRNVLTQPARYQPDVESNAWHIANLTVGQIGRVTLGDATQSILDRMI